MQTETQDPELAHELDTEPAETIGSIWADKAMIKTYVTAALSLAAFALNFVVPDGQIDNIVTLLSGLGLLVTAGMAQWEARQRAIAQGKETREHVYAPATVQKLIGVDREALVTRALDELEQASAQEAPGRPA